MDNDNSNEIINIEQIDEQVLAKSISDAVLEFDKVSRFATSGITESVTKNVLRKENPTQGIKINIDDNKIIINIHIFVYYGINIPQLSYDIQSKIKLLVEDITKCEVKSVNISVVGIDRIKKSND